MKQKGFRRLIPLGIGILLLPFLLIFFRIKTTEMGIQSHSLYKKIQSSTTQKKGLEAERARLLTPTNLKKWADKFHLDLPPENRIIVVP